MKKKYKFVACALIMAAKQMISNKLFLLSQSVP